MFVDCFTPVAEFLVILYTCIQPEVMGPKADLRPLLYLQSHSRPSVVVPDPDQHESALILVCYVGKNELKNKKKVKMAGGGGIL
jgi:hypothetical protein